jgi:alpha-glucosidase (family GH31 glycosyl hydrolase)
VAALGVETDGGEHAWGSELVYLDGRSGDEKNNTYPVSYAQAYGSLLTSAGKAPVTFSRAGFSGSQAHGAFWAGDENSTWDAFRWSMNAGLSAASCGIVYWGWDIAGFSGEIPGAELLTLEQTGHELPRRTWDLVVPAVLEITYG